MTMQMGVLDEWWLGPDYSGLYGQIASSIAPLATDISSGPAYASTVGPEPYPDVPVASDVASGPAYASPVYQPAAPLAPPTFQGQTQLSPEWLALLAEPQFAAEYSLDEPEIVRGPFTVDHGVSGPVGFSTPGEDLQDEPPFDWTPSTSYPAGGALPNAASRAIAGMQTVSDLAADPTTPFNRSPGVGLGGLLNPLLAGLDKAVELTDAPPLLTAAGPGGSAAASLLQMLGVDQPTLGEGVDYGRERAIEAAGLAGTDKRVLAEAFRQVGLDGVADALESQAAFESGAARTAADWLLPRSTLEVLLELLPGVGSVDDIAQGFGRGFQAADNLGMRLGDLPEGAVRRTALQVPEYSDEALRLAGTAGETTIPRAAPPAQAAQAPFGVRLAGAADETPPPISAANPPDPMTVHQAIPRPSALRTVDDLAQDALSQSSVFNRLAEEASVVPPVRTAINLVNPSALVRRPTAALVDALGEDGAIKLQSQLIGYERRVDRANALVGAIEEDIAQAARRVHLTVQDGRVTSVEGAPYLDELFETPSRFPLTKAQRAFVDEVAAVLEDMNRLEKATGVPKGEIFSAEGRYFPRRVLSEQGIQNYRPSVRRPVGIKQAFQKERLFETMEEGMRAGVVYDDNIAGVVGARLRAGLKAVADKEVAELIKPLGHTVTKEQQARLDEMGTMIPAFGGRVFDADVSRRLIEVLGTRYPGDIERFMTKVNGVLTPLQAQGDLSFTLLQLLPSGFRNPAAFAKAMGTALDAVILDGRLYGRYIIDNAAQLERFVDAGLMWRGSDLSLSRAASGRLMSKLFGKGPGGRLAAAFDNALNVAALENAKAMAGLSKVTGPGPVRRLLSAVMGNVTGQTSDEIAASIANKMTGRLSSRSLGVSAAQQSMEANAAFAARYYRAAIGLLADAMQGGMRGAEARAIFGSLVAGAATIHWAMAEALGQEPNFDPFSSKFLTVRVGDRNVGPGGAFFGIFRTVAEAYENPDSLDDLLSMDNPVTRWLRGRSSPLVSLAVDLASQKDFLGNDVSSLEEIAKHIGTRLMPFTAQEAIKEGELSGAVTFLGGRSFPVSAADELGRVIENDAIPALIAAGALPEALRGLGRQALGSGEDDLLMAWLRENRPELLDRYIEERRRWGSVFQQAADAAKELDETKYKPELDRLFASLQAGADPTRVFDEVQRLMDRRAGERAQIYGKDFAKAIEGLERNDIRTIEAMWDAIPSQARDQHGFIDWARVEEERSKLLDDLAATDPALAQRFANNILLRDRTADMHPLLQLKAETDAASRAYFDLPDDQRDEYLRANPELNAQRWLVYGTGLQSIEAVEQALNSGLQREVTISGSKVPITQDNIGLVKQYESQIEQLLGAGTDRTRLRKANAVMDALWIYLGFAEVAQSNLDEVNRLLDQWGSPLRARPAAR